MNKVITDIFHMGNARITLRKALAFCGLMSILLTAACSPTPSNTTKIATPVFSDEIENEFREGIQVLPEALPEKQPVAEEKPKADVDSKPEVIAKPVEKINPAPEAVPQATTPAKNQTAASTQTGGVANADSSISKSSIPAANSTAIQDSPSTADRLVGNYLWATMPTFVNTYKDSSGQVHEHFLVASGDSPELKALLAKLRDELVAGNRPSLEIKEQGSCGNSEDQKQASAKSCNTSAPICLSLESVQPQDVRPLILREFARQHCADEALALQVQKYYEHANVRNFKNNSSVASAFNRVRVSLLYVQAALTTGLTPNAGAYAQKIDTKEDICSIVLQGVNQAQKLQSQLASAGELSTTLSGMNVICANSTLDRQSLQDSLSKAIKVYDQLAQEFSKNSGMIVIDFSKHLWAH